jgi:hypothetical protein
MLFLHGWLCLQLQLDGFSSVPPVYWTLQNLKDNENKQKILHYSSVFTAATVKCGTGVVDTLSLILAKCSAKRRNEGTLLSKFTG